MRKMSETKQTIEERLTKLEENQYELMENVYGVVESIRFTLAKIKEDHYETPEEGKKDELDLSIEEIQDSLKYIGDLMEEEE